MDQFSVLKQSEFILGHNDIIWNIKYHPKLQMFASCSSDIYIKLFLHDSQSKKYCQIFSIKDEHSKTIRCIEWSPDGTLLASGSFDSLIVIWRFSQYKLQTVCCLQGHESEVKCLSWHINGELLASCSRDTTIQIWEKTKEDDNIEFEVCSVMTGHSQDVKFIKWLHDSELLISCSYDDTIKIWIRDIQEDDWLTLTTIIGHESTVWAIDVNSSMLMVSVSQDSSLKCWDLNILTNYMKGNQSDNDFVEVKCIQTIDYAHTRPIYAVAFNQDQDLIVTAGGDNRINLFKTGIDQETGIKNIKMVAQLQNAHDQDVNTVVFDNQGDQVISAGDDGIIKIWDIIYENILI